MLTEDQKLALATAKAVAYLLTIVEIHPQRETERINRRREMLDAIRDFQTRAGRP